MATESKSSEAMAPSEKDIMFWRYQFARLAAGYHHLICELDGRKKLTRDAGALHSAVMSDCSKYERETDMPVERRMDVLVFAALHGLPPFDSPGEGQHGE